MTFVPPGDIAMLSKRSFLSGAGASIALLGATRIAFADPAAPSTYPARPVRWVVPYAPGGATDVMSRLVCQRLSQRLGRSFIVENKPGAGSTVGTEAVINSAPDGYTLLLTSTANAINASFDPSLRFDFAKAIVPVAGLARIPLVMVINNDLPVETVAEFVSYAKAHPGKLSAASSGVGTSLHLSGELFKAMTGVDFVHVPYRGSAPALVDLMSGQVQVMFDNVTSSAEFVRAGKVRALGVTTRQRSAALPDVPPIADSVLDYETSSFYGVGAPRRTPAQIVALLNREINAALADPEISDALAELGALPITGNADEFAAMLAAETERWRKVVERSGARAN
jgi:tripartite-type tricarboxylate transporter receptor subunit TctC